MVILAPHVCALGLALGAQCGNLNHALRRSSGIVLNAADGPQFEEDSSAGEWPNLLRELRYSYRQFEV